MALKITEECIGCGACEPECPNQAITFGDPYYVIDADLCTECLGFHQDQQCALVCPVACCVADHDHAEDKDALIEKYTKLHPNEPPKAVEHWAPPAA
ncbi:MAG: YfhL family 4Fe-4S dicluster ferredoxin [Actinobacteria bacterium]|nr:YfhL family 4Fe-4S dicluster ferredoxin [Actinomycetota bacterium]